MAETATHMRDEQQHEVKGENKKDRPHEHDHDECERIHSSFDDVAKNANTDDQHIHLTVS